MGTLTTRVKSTKSLGVMIDERLVWDELVDSLRKRVSSGLAALKQAHRYVPQTVPSYTNHSLNPFLTTAMCFGEI